MWRKKFQQVELDRGYQDFLNHAVESFIKRENNEAKRAKSIKTKDKKCLTLDRLFV